MVVTMPSPSLATSLPTELSLGIAEYLLPPALSALCQTGRYYRSIYDPVLAHYLFGDKERIIRRAIVFNCSHFLSHCVKKSLTLDCARIGSDLLCDVVKWGFSEVMWLLLGVEEKPNFPIDLEGLIASNNAIRMFRGGIHHQRPALMQSGRTPLYYGVAARRSEMALRWVEKGAKINSAVYYVLHEKWDDVMMKAVFSKRRLYRHQTKPLGRV
ncbi:hypothetical protein DFP73DRAFT_595675 [Morchella snyderi]|nr:hypothetical protein DFP73DRAFT_595675 [Morchella snyderi]